MSRYGQRPSALVTGEAETFERLYFYFHLDHVRRGGRHPPSEGQDYRWDQFVVSNHIF